MFRTVREITVRCTLAPLGRGQGEGSENTSVISRTILRHPWVITFAAFMLAAQMAGPSLQAATISYELGISTDLDLLRNPDDPASQRSAVGKTRLEIAVARETPLFRLTNTSSDASITSISISLNTNDYLFDAVVVAEAPIGLAPTVVSPADTVHGQSTSPIVGFSFDDRPLQPNESFAFWVDIDPSTTAPSGPIDYRNILWDRWGNLRDDNALVEVNFDMATAKPVPLFEFAMLSQTVVSSLADGTSGRSLVVPLVSGSDAIGAFFLSQTYPNENAPAPEPSGLALLATGLLFLSAGRRRRCSVRSA
jgi:hypothetical protein